MTHALARNEPKSTARLFCCAASIALALGCHLGSSDDGDVQFTAAGAPTTTASGGGGASAGGMGTGGNAAVTTAGAGAATTAGNGGLGGMSVALGGAGQGGLAAGGAGQAGTDGGRAGAAGSAAGGNGGSGGGNSNDYAPCPTDGSPCKILPLGDSITWGIQYDGAYRVKLFANALADKHAITFTGTLSNGPSMVSGQPFPQSNEGHSGKTIDFIAGRVPAPALGTLPHMVLLMIGTNDVYAPSGQAQMPQRLGALLDKLTTAAPNALIVVAKITPLDNAEWNATIKTYNDAIPGLVQTRASAGKHVILADMNTGFKSEMLSTDHIHPNKAGYDFMADAWYAQIRSYLR